MNIKLIKHLTISVDVLYLFLILFSYLELLSKFWNMLYIFNFILIVNTIWLIFKIKRIPEEKRENSSRVYMFRHLLLLSLIVIALNQFLKKQVIIDFMPYLISLSIAFGFLTFYAYKNKVEKEIEQEKDDEQKEEEKRKNNFANVHPNLNRIPIFKYLLRWMYVDGWGYSSIVILLILIGFGIRLYKLGDLSLWWDELITGSIVTKILEKGLPYFPIDTQFYWRGLTYHYFVTLFTWVFKNNEFWLRFPSILFGMGIIITTFYISRKFNKIIAIGVLSFLIFSTYNIEYSRFARFYILNSFLFLISIIFIWNGFYKNLKYFKLFSVIIFFIMQLTVETGKIWIAPFLSVLLICLRFNIKKNINSYFEFMKSNLIYFIFVIIVFLLKNPFELLFSRKINLAEIVLNGLPKNPTQAIIQWPKGSILSFFNQYHLPTIFLIICCIVFFYLIFNFKFDKNNSKLVYLTYLFLTFVISMVAFEVINQGFTGARIFLIFEAVYVLLIVCSMYILIRLFFTKKYITFLILSILFLLSLNITPNLYERLNFKYGDSVSNDPFRTVDIASYRSDFKTTSLYVVEHAENDDSIIYLVGRFYSYYYLRKSPDIIFNQAYIWYSDVEVLDNGQLRDYTVGGTVINDLKKLKDYINSSTKNVYLIVNGASVNTTGAVHIRQDFKNFLNENNDKVVYQSPDKVSKVLLFKKI